MRHVRWLVAILLCGLWLGSPFPAQSAEPGDVFRNFILKEAAELRRDDRAPQSLAEWHAERVELRDHLLKAWGGFPETPCSLEPKILTILPRDGFHIEKLLFQTMPGIWMTANAYIPDTPGKHPAVLCVHGHWQGAKQDPHVQARCIGLAKLGFVALAVDAFGAGERGIGKALGEYHGEMVGAALLPIGRPLSGIQVYENMRAVDYLLTRVEVDSDHIGITGASGGGNQAMYAGAWDERFDAVVPVCSVGNYQAYLGNACCMCEVVPGALQFTEEWGTLGLVAPRALMVVNATRDSIPFSVNQAEKSLALARPIFGLYGVPDHLKHAVFESTHDYNQPMREAMYGWMTLHLKGVGTGKPILEPQMQLDDPEALRCLPGETRPDHWITIPEFVNREVRRLTAKIKKPTDQETWRAEAARIKSTLDQQTLAGTQPPSHVQPDVSPTSSGTRYEFEVEPGIRLTAQRTPTTSDKRIGTVVLLSMEGLIGPEQNALAEKVLANGWDIVGLELRATGEHAWPRDRVGRAADHNTAEWSLWLGRPLLGQWVKDVRTLLSVLTTKGDNLGRVTVAGYGPAGVVAACTAAIDTRIDQTVMIESLASYGGATPMEQQRLGLLAPGIVRDAGDIPHIAALIAPRRLIVAGGRNSNGQGIPADQLHQQYQFTADVYGIENAADNLIVLPAGEINEVVRTLQ